MFWRSKEKQQPPQFSARDLLFGDLPRSAWPESKQQQVEPWQSFIKSREQLEAGNQPGSIASLQQIVTMTGLESRHYLQAWHFLRGLGVFPANGDGKRLYGVVVEVALKRGLDLLAAYADGTARYFNWSGAGIVWERPDNSLDPLIKSLLDLGQQVVDEIGPWDAERPPAPPEGYVRINLLVPSGLHFGYGLFEQLEADSLGGPLITAATRLMQALIAKSEKR